MTSKVVKSKVDYLILISSLQAGGAETQAVAWAKSLHQEGKKVCIVSLKTGILEKKLKEVGVEYLLLTESGARGIRRFLIFIKFMKVIGGLARSRRPEAIIAFLYPETLAVSILSILRRLDTKLVLGRRADFGYGDKSRLMQKIMSYGYRRSSAVFTNSLTNIPAALRDGVNPSRIVKISNYLRDDLPSHRSSRHLRSKPEVIRIFSVGNLFPIKGHERAIQVMSALQVGLPNKRFRYDIFGSGPEHDRLERAARTERVELTLRGQVTNPWELAKEFDILLHTSFTEGSSNVLWEAAACGFPIVTSAVGDVLDLSRLCPKSILVANSEEEFVRNLLLILSEDSGVWAEALEASFSVREMRRPENVTRELVQMLDSLQ